MEPKIFGEERLHYCFSGPREQGRQAADDGLVLPILFCIGHRGSPARHHVGARSLSRCSV
jgi:hypothetical protein